MELGTSTLSMPDVKAVPCDYPAAGSPAVCGIDFKHYSNELPSSLSALEHQLTVLSCKSAMTYSSVHERQEHCRAIPGAQENTVLANLGANYFTTNNSMNPLKNINSQLSMEDLCPTKANACHVVGTVAIGNAETRLYRSLENLQWAAVADSSFYTFSPPYRSADRDFFFQCKATSHWCEVSSEKPQAHGLVQSNGNVSLHRKKTQVHKDLPPFAKVPLGLFPSMDERILNGDAKRGLKEKLRLHSSKVMETNKPVRPQVSPGELVLREFAQKPAFLHRLTSPEEIKQEAMRRLQLRRQNSSPNLHLHQAEEAGEVVKSKTADSLKGCKSTEALELSSDKKRNPKGRLYIPTFEEFKRMRKKEKCIASANEEMVQKLNANSSADPRPEDEMHEENSQLGTGDHRKIKDYNESYFEFRGSINVLNHQCKMGSALPSEQDQISRSCDFLKGNDYKKIDAAPICTSPIPRSPLQTQVTSKEKEEVECKQQLLSKKRFSRTHSFPEQLQAYESQSTCCPSLLLDAADLASYGAKLQKMKDGLIDSALDLIKKSCSAEIAAESVVVSYDLEKADITSQEEGNESGGVTMETQACSNEKKIKKSKKLIEAQPTECHSSPGCRRSSSDVAYESPDSVKVQRECRLRPHFSDPMPADAVKRKQLEMKIAVAARLHAQKRRQERDAASTIQGCSSNLRPGESDQGPGLSQRTKHRWSNLSSLSTDSGIVGLNDEKEEKEEEEEEAGSSSNVKLIEVERVDSGIGPALAKNWKGKAVEASVSMQAWEAHRPCSDCGERDTVSESGAQRNAKKRENLCKSCTKRRTERKEAILEFLNTEQSYGEDLRIIKEEFYLPMQSAGLLMPDQLAVVFSNVQELIDLNEKFADCLQEATDQAQDQGDEDLLTVCIGEIFLEFVNMLPAFQTYCLQQSASVNMLNNLEKEKELLRIFLNVSQNDNTVLRRMNLRSFLMAPLQRVTKYPLLLSRISKATIEYHPDHSSLREAKSRVESHLEHINMKTKQEGNSWSLRSFRRDSKKNREVINIEMREMSIKTIGWPREDTRFVMEGTLQFAQPPDGQWVKKGSKALKFQNVHALLMVNMKRTSEPSLEGVSSESFTQLAPIRDAVLILIKDKSSSKFTLLREPVRLSNCVVSVDPDCEDTFELLEIRREAFVFRDSDKTRTHRWFGQFKRYSQELGSWNKRRNALPNIMISTTPSRS
ncbi:uncharacterized protein SI:DKEY-91I10.2 [Latimeria chalumnae]|uniref:uncharacterized protein SI:DKEY-91I10.2 n=1 Tax=Latimeria chalumnae TaxID=7897 RepID=UPI00313DBD11